MPQSLRTISEFDELFAIASISVIIHLKEQTDSEFVKEIDLEDENLKAE